MSKDLSSPRIDVPAASILAKAAAKTRFETAPPEVQQKVVDVLVDLLGVMALGSDRAELQRLRGRLAVPGSSTVIGSPAPAPAPLAALLNAMTCTVHQIDEGHRESRGHAGIHIVPATLAIAEEQGKSGADLLSATLAGYEAAVRIGRALNGMAPGIHPHGNWATLGAAASVAHLLTGGDERAIETAMEGAAAIALFPDRETIVEGVTIHHLFVGLGAQIGVQAGCAAACGFSAVPGTIERFFGPRSGAAFDATLLLKGVDTAASTWANYEILNNYYKLYPVCGHVMTANEAVDALLAKQPIDPEAVEQVDVRTYRACYTLSNPRPATDLAARFSVPYTVAVALVTGELGVDSFSDALLSDPRVLDLAARVHMHLDPVLDAGFPTARPTAVAVRLKDGTVLESELRIARGDASNPVTREELHAKARRLLARRFGDGAAGKVLAAALDLERGGDLGALTEALRAAARGR